MEPSEIREPGGSGEGEQVTPALAFMAVLLVVVLAMAYDSDDLPPEDEQ